MANVRRLGGTPLYSDLTANTVDLLFVLLQSCVNEPSGRDVCASLSKPVRDCILLDL